jgi:hypothetical protein
MVVLIIFLVHWFIFLMDKDKEPPIVWLIWRCRQSQQCFQLFLFSYSPFLIKGGTQTEGVWEQGAEEDIWTEEEWVTGEWRRLHNKELHDLYSSPSIIRIIKSRMMRWAGHVAHHYTTTGFGPYGPSSGGIYTVSYGSYYACNGRNRMQTS